MLEVLQALTLPMVVIGCGVSGYILKEYIPLNNKHIPLIMATLGVVLNWLINGYISVESTIIAGAVSGLASTGMHQVFVQYFNKKDGE